MGYDGSLKFDTEIVEKGFATGIKNIGNIAKGGLQVLGTAVIGTATAFGVLTKKSLDSVASLEQNIGGVETLFKKSAKTVIDNANKAYKTAGMSANEYMQNVTSFSASLLQSVAGDTNEAARIADMAMVDMSDNANKMGSNMQDIQNAYQGFAKQNYTMLDNLKLGYGGTKTEMERLLKDAQKISGVKYDIKNLNDVYEAVHVIQGELGITGTTAIEAATTIEGSMNMAKAAFDNFLNGSGSAEELADSIAVAAGNIAKNIGEIVPRLAPSLAEVGKELLTDLSESISENADQVSDAGADIILNLTMGIAQAIPVIFSTALQVVNAFITNISERIPQILSVGAQILTALISGMAQLLPSIGAFALTLFQQLYDQISAAAPGLLQKGYEILNNLITGFVAAIPEALPKVLDFIQGIGEKLAEAAPVMIQKGFELLSKLVEGIVSAIPILISRVPEIISTFANIINNNFPTILKKGVEILLQLTKGILSAIPTLIANIPKIVSAIVDVIEAFNWLSLGKNIIKFFKDGIMSMVGAVKSAGTSVYNSVKNAITNLPSTLADIGKNAIHGLGNTISGLASFVKNSALKIVSSIKSALLKLPDEMISVGKNIVQGLWNGISGMVGWMTNKVKGFANSILGGIKSALGIHSPSTVFRDQVGKYMAKGVGVGFIKNVPTEEIQDSISGLTNRVQREVNVGALRIGLAYPTYRENPSDTSRKHNFEIDYDRLGKSTAKALDGMAVTIDGRKAGKILAEPVDNEIGQIGQRRT